MPTSRNDSRQLLETMLRQVDVPLSLSAVEGDALFLYAERPADDDVWHRRSRTLVDRLITMLRQFRERQIEIGSYSVCMCEACANVGNLELKIIVHAGEAMFTHVGQYLTLSGVDVIALHRLAKNSVPEPRYVLMTAAAQEALGVPDGVDADLKLETIAAKLNMPPMDDRHTALGDAIAVALMYVRLKHGARVG